MSNLSLVLQQQGHLDEALEFLEVSEAADGYGLLLPPLAIFASHMGATPEPARPLRTLSRRGRRAWVQERSTL